MKKIWIIVGVVLFISVSVSYLLLSRKYLANTSFSLLDLNERRCWKEDQAGLAVFNGKLLSKHRDKSNHNYKTIVVMNLDDEVTSYILVGEVNGLYEYLQEGDTVIKQKGELKVTVVRNRISETKELEYDCKR